MNPKPRTHEPAGGDGLFFIIAFAIVAVVTIESLFIAFSSWWLMSAVLMIVILAAVGVSAALVRLMEDDTPIARPARRPGPEPEPVPAVRPLPAAHARVVTH
jgi:hypothetical protein